MIIFRAEGYTQVANIFYTIIHKSVRYYGLVCLTSPTHQVVTFQAKESISHSLGLGER
jgi:hypothetical protein